MLGIYHLNSVQLEQRIKDELDENPLLEANSDDEIISPDGPEKDQPQDYQDLEEYQYDDVPDYRLETESYYTAIILTCLLKTRLISDRS